MANIIEGLVCVRRYDKICGSVDYDAHDKPNLQVPHVNIIWNNSSTSGTTEVAIKNVSFTWRPSPVDLRDKTARCYNTCDNSGKVNNGSTTGTGVISTIISGTYTDREEGDAIQSRELIQLNVHPAAQSTEVQQVHQLSTRGAIGGDAHGNDYTPMMELGTDSDPTASQQLIQMTPTPGIGNHGGTTPVSTCTASGTYRPNPVASGSLDTPLLERGVFTLKELYFTLNIGEVALIVGDNSSCGKSSFLHAVLGNMPICRTALPLKWVRSIECGAPVGYVAQSPWIPSGTVRDIILCGRQYDPLQYSRAVSACALVHDFEVSWKGIGDMRMIDEGGAVLSGGQRQRVCLARAVYGASSQHIPAQYYRRAAQSWAFPLSTESIFGNTDSNGATPSPVAVGGHVNAYGCAVESDLYQRNSDAAWCSSVRTTPGNTTPGNRTGNLGDYHHCRSQIDADHINNNSSGCRTALLTTTTRVSSSRSSRIMQQTDVHHPTTSQMGASTLFLLDEPFTNLDPQTMTEVFTSLFIGPDALLANSATIITVPPAIAHQLLLIPEIKLISHKHRHQQDSEQREDGSPTDPTTPTSSSSSTGTSGGAVTRIFRLSDGRVNEWDATSFLDRMSDSSSETILLQQNYFARTATPPSTANTNTSELSDSTTSMTLTAIAPNTKSSDPVVVNLGRRVTDSPPVAGYAELAEGGAGSVLVKGDMKEKMMKGQTNIDAVWWFIKAMTIPIVVVITVCGAIVGLTSQGKVVIGGMLKSRDSNAAAYFVVGVGLAQTLGAVVGDITNVFGILRGGVYSHRLLTSSVLGAPNSFYSSTKVGTLANMYATDMASIDAGLAHNYYWMIERSTVVLISFTLTVLIAPIQLLLFIAIFLWFGRGLLGLSFAAMRESQRFRMISGGPQISLFSQVESGGCTVRALRRENYYYSSHYDALQVLQNARIFNKAVALWTTLRMRLLTFPILLIAAVLPAIARLFEFGTVMNWLCGTAAATDMSVAALQGVAITINMNLADHLVDLVSSYALVIRKFVSVERIYNVALTSGFGPQSIITKQQSKSHYDDNKEKLNPSALRSSLFPQHHSTAAALSNTQTTTTATALRRVHTGYKTAPALEALQKGDERQYVSFVHPCNLNRGLVLDNLELRHGTLDGTSANSAISDFTAYVAPGEHIGIVGRSGSGKTTLLMGILGLETPIRGTITLNGVALNGIQAKERRHFMAILPTTPVVFEGWSLRNMIDPDNAFTDQEIIECYKSCGLYDEVRALCGPKGIRAVLVGEHGNSPDIEAPFTDMQIRRLCVARLLLEAKNTSVIVVDEPPMDDGGNHDGVDRHSSTPFVTVNDLLKRLCPWCIVLLVSHHASSLQGCDRIWTIADGRLVVDTKK
eukprot:Lankesteria_metandrocarpae@DN5380_c0_g1_i1.p1